MISHKCYSNPHVLMMWSKASKDSSRGFQVSSEINFLISVRKAFPTSGQTLTWHKKISYLGTNPRTQQQNPRTQSPRRDLARPTPDPTTQIAPAVVLNRAATRPPTPFFSSLHSSSPTTSTALLTLAGEKGSSNPSQIRTISPNSNACSPADGSSEPDSSTLSSQNRFLPLPDLG